MKNKLGINRAPRPPEPGLRPILRTLQHQGVHISSLEVKYPVQPLWVWQPPNAATPSADFVLFVECFRVLGGGGLSFSAFSSLFSRSRSGSGSLGSSSTASFGLRSRDRVLPRVQAFSNNTVAPGGLAFAAAIASEVCAIELGVLDEPWLEPGLGGVWAVASAGRLVHHNLTIESFSHRGCGFEDYFLLGNAGYG